MCCVTQSLASDTLHPDHPSPVSIIITGLFFYKPGNLYLWRGACKGLQQVVVKTTKFTCLASRRNNETLTSGAFLSRDNFRLGYNGSLSDRQSASGTRALARSELLNYSDETSDDEM